VISEGFGWTDKDNQIPPLSSTFLHYKNTTILRKVKKKMREFSFFLGATVFGGYAVA